ncbi:NAC domain superfamily [Arabidopsis suecica]|uniref:NAC domain superfamily n=1 Tax=Arabidopsis suecica TaxID=45249 RepID=A0A8T1ZBP3_ARASU|nr:NAC domain superfamily [Arabidopsis suecica]
MLMVEEFYDEEEELVGFRFNPSEEELILDYLLPKLGFDQPKTIYLLEDKDEIYAKVPWRLKHTENGIFEPNEWFYFVKKTNRKVKGWKATGGLKDILSKKNGKVIGKKRNRSLYVGGEPSGWTMTEYSSIGNQNQLLCHLKGP